MGGDYRGAIQVLKSQKTEKNRGTCLTREEGLIRRLLASSYCNIRAQSKKLRGRGTGR